MQRDVVHAGSGRPPGAGFARAVAGGISWKGVAVTQSLGALFAVSSWLEAMNDPTAPPLLVLLLRQSLAGALVLLAACGGDEAVSRGHGVLRTFALALALACTGAGLIQWGLDGWLGAPVRTPEPVRALHAGLDLGTYWGTALLAYLNRRSAVRVLARLRSGELARLTAERRLVEAQLAATGAELDPAVVLRRLAELRDLYASGDARADRCFERLSQDLRDRVTRAAAAAAAIEAGAAVGSEGARP